MILGYAVRLDTVERKTLVVVYPSPGDAHGRISSEPTQRSGPMGKVDKGA